MALVGVLTLLFSGCRQNPFGATVLDGPGMVNPNGELADRLQGEWTSDDGRFTAMFTDLDVELTFGDQKVTTRYNSDYLATSPAAETHMMPVDNALTRPGEEEPFVWIQLFFTDGALDAELTYPDGTIERLALTRTEG